VCVCVCVCVCLPVCCCSRDPTASPPTKPLRHRQAVHSTHLSPAAIGLSNTAAVLGVQSPPTPPLIRRMRRSVDRPLPSGGGGSVLDPKRMTVHPHPFRPTVLKPLGVAHSNPRSPRPPAALAEAYPSGSQTARTTTTAMTNAALCKLCFIFGLLQVGCMF